MFRESDNVGRRQAGFVQVVKVGVSQGHACRDPLWRVVGQHFLHKDKTQKEDRESLGLLCVFTRKSSRTETD